MIPYLQARGVEFNSARKRMALVPQPSNVYWTDGLWVPTINIKNVYIFPGIPSLFEKMLLSLIQQDTRLHHHQVIKRIELVIDGIGEGDFGDTLRNIAAQYSTVEIGSYPVDTKNYIVNAINTAPSGTYRPRVVLTLQSRDYEMLDRAVQQCQQEIGGTIKPAE